MELKEKEMEKGLIQKVNINWWWAKKNNPHNSVECLLITTTTKKTHKKSNVANNDADYFIYDLSAKHFILCNIHTEHSYTVLRQMEKDVISRTHGKLVNFPLIVSSGFCAVEISLFKRARIFFSTTWFVPHFFMCKCVLLQQYWCDRFSVSLSWHSLIIGRLQSFPYPFLIDIYRELIKNIKQINIGNIRILVMQFHRVFHRVFAYKTDFRSLKSFWNFESHSKCFHCIDISLIFLEENYLRYKIQTLSFEMLNLIGWLWLWLWLYRFYMQNFLMIWQKFYASTQVRFIRAKNFTF